MSSARFSAGTSLTTGLPCLVTTMGSPVFETWSMIARHCALNCPAAICFIVWSYYYDYGKKAIVSSYPERRRTAVRAAGPGLAAAGGFGLATLVLAAGIGGLGLVMLIGFGRGIRASAPACWSAGDGGFLVT